MVSEHSDHTATLQMVRLIRLTMGFTREEQAELERASCKELLRERKHHIMLWYFRSLLPPSFAVETSWERCKAMRVYHNSTTFFAALKPSGDINGTTHFRVEAGAVHSPRGSIHLSDIFPAYSLYHILHPARHFSPPNPHLSPKQLLSRPMLVKTHVPVSAKHTQECFSHYWWLLS